MTESTKCLQGQYFRDARKAGPTEAPWSPAGYGTKTLQWPLQNWRGNVNNICHPLLLQLLCTSGDKQIPGMQSLALFCDDFDSSCPSSSAIYQTHKRGRKQVGKCTHLVSRRIKSLGWSRGPYLLHVHGSSKNMAGNPKTVFSGLGMQSDFCRSLLSTGILRSGHFHSLLFPPEISSLSLLPLICLQFNF